MEIKIIRNTNNIMLDQNEALWEHVKDNKSVSFVLNPLLSLVVGSITILICFLSSKFGDHFWGPLSTVGILMTFYALSIYFTNYNQKKYFFEQTKLIVENLNNNNSITEILLTESEIRIKDFQSFYELNWTVFKNIQQNKSYFFLMYDKSYQNGIIISKTELTEPQLDELSNFIQLKK